jgi:hypothetical protein
MDNGQVLFIVLFLFPDCYTCVRSHVSVART